jgi:3-oxoacyl-[acyl-carrier protein] reductase
MLKLNNKNILVTGVSRSQGIGAAIARTLALAGANVIVHGYAPYDFTQNYSDADGKYLKELGFELEQQNIQLHRLKGSDLSQKDAPEKVIQQAVERMGYINGLVLNHAHSTWVPLGEWSAQDIDAHLSVNVRASMLMIQAFAKQLPKQEEGSVTLFTSGQFQGPMIKEIAYAVSKDAVIGLCRQASAALAPRKIRVNCINPGPTDTGYLSGDEYDEVARMFPGGKWLVPDDAARLVHFLQSDYARTITGQIISSDAGFNT